MLGWGIEFARNCTPERFRENAKSNLHLALHSLKSLQEIGFALGGVDVAPHSEWIGGGSGSVEQRQTGDQIIVGEAHFALDVGTDGIGSRKVARAGVIPQAVQKDEALVDIAARVARIPTRNIRLRAGRFAGGAHQHQRVGPQLRRHVPLVCEVRLGVAATKRNEPRVGTAERVAQNAQASALAVVSWPAVKMVAT